LSSAGDVDDVDRVSTETEPETGLDTGPEDCDCDVESWTDEEEKEVETDELLDDVSAGMDQTLPDRQMVANKKQARRMLEDPILVLRWISLRR
jgi:hypothetical protein